MITQELLLRNHQSPGDVLMLTAAVRDLHRCYPGEFRVAVETSCPFLWENNPYLVSPSDLSNARVIDCQYPLISRSNQEQVHFLEGFIENLNQQLDLQIRLSAFCGDVHLGATERAWPCFLQSFSKSPVPYWIVVAGGKYDFTIKWWHTKRFQTVIEALKDEVIFIQVGAWEHYHPRLEGVLDLRGKTQGRDIVKLMHHANGVLCPVTFMMHLAAAVERVTPELGSRSCVAIAGGREPVSWEKYPDHVFLDTIGKLNCCAQGGCWRSRFEPIGDGDEKDEAHQLCVDVIDHLPRCMAMIEPEVVVNAVRETLKSQGERIDRGALEGISELRSQDPVREILRRETL